MRLKRECRVETNIRRKIYGSQSLISPQFGDAEKVCKWQNLKQSCIGNDEQCKKIDQDITDTPRIADAYLDSKKRALCATAERRNP